MKISALSATSAVKFKGTELGPLPEDWQVVRLGEVFEIQQGKSLSPKSRAGSRKRPFLRTANVFWGYLNLSSLDEMHFEEAEEKRLTLKPGDLLVCEGGDIGRTAIWEGQLPVCFYQNHLHRLRTNRNDACPLFYMYWMQAAWILLGLYGGAGNKTTIPNLSQSRLSSFPIPLPPLPEQRAIAHVLRTVQQAREATERVIAALRDLKKSLMRHLFTYGPVPIAHVGAKHVSPLRETEIGPLPEHWQVVRLGELVAKGVLWIKNGFPQGEHNQTGLGIPHLRPFNITDTGDITLSQIKYVPSPAEDSLYWVLPGDVIFNNTNSEELVGKTAYFNINGKFVISNHMTLIRASSDEIDAYWLSKYLHWLWSQGVFQGLCRRHVNQASVSLERLKQVSIPLPPLAEQREIARILQAVDRRIAAEEAYARALGELFRALLGELMSGRRRVQFTPENRESTP